MPPLTLSDVTGLECEIGRSTVEEEEELVEEEVPPEVVEIVPFADEVSANFCRFARAAMRFSSARLFREFSSSAPDPSPPTPG